MHSAASHVFFFTHLSLEAHARGKYSSIVKSVAVQIIANKIINKIAPPNSLTIHYNIGLKTGISAAQIIYSIYDEAKNNGEGKHLMNTKIMYPTSCARKLNATINFLPERKRKRFSRAFSYYSKKQKDSRKYD